MATTNAGNSRSKDEKQKFKSDRPNNGERKEFKNFKGKATTARKAGKTEKKKERAILRESPISRSQRMVDITEALTEMPDLERIRTRMISR